MVLRFSLEKISSNFNLAKKVKVIKGGLEKIDGKKKLFIIIALPPKILLTKFHQYIDLFHKADFITDCTSVKESLLKQVKKNNLQSKFILSHPIAGSEKSGFLNSNENMFKDKVSIISEHNGLKKDTLQTCKRNLV